MAGEGAQIDSEALNRARDAVANNDWETAAGRFTEADARERLGAADLESWATATYMLGRPEDAVEALGRAHLLHVESGDPERALRAGAWVVFILSEEGEAARAGGWMARCERLVGELPDDSVAHSFILVLHAYRLIAVEGDYPAGIALADRVIEVAGRAGDHDISTLALNLKGRAQIRDGHIDDGLGVLDEAMVSVVSGLLTPIVVGTVYCSLIEACEEVVELRRAQEWTEALDRWCESQAGEIPFTAQCRIHRSKLMQRSGDLKRARQEAEDAYELFTRTPYHTSRGQAMYQLGEVLRVSGQLSEAESAYLRASELGIDPQPGLALVRLALGEPEAAVASMRRLLVETADAPQRIALLPAFVEVMLATGDLAAANSAVTELAGLAATYQTQHLRATAAYAEGALRLVQGNPETALVGLRTACSIWQELNAPYETARTRFLIGHACNALGDHEAARLEMGAAEAYFAEIGVAGMPALAVPSEATDHGLTARELEVLNHLTTGATNREIADQLFLSVKTVDRHVASILTKLGVSSRTAAVAFAYEHDLV